MTINFNPFNYRAITFLEFLTQANKNELFADKPEWIKILLAGRTDLLASYIDGRANDNMFHSMYTKRNTLNFARYLNYSPVSADVASGFVRVSLVEGTELPRTVKREDLLFSTAGSSGSDKVFYSPDTDFEFTQATMDVPVKEGRIYSDVLSYVCNGNAFEEIPLPRTNPVGTVELIINGQSYTQVNSLVTSVGTDKHFRPIRTDSGVVLRGGDAEYGEVFPFGYSPTVTARYGGGTRGNQPAGAVDTYLGGDDAVDPTVTNIEKMQGGKNEEGITSIKTYAPMSVAAQERAVKISDFKYHSERYTGIVRAFVEPNYYGTGSIRVQVVPPSGGDTLQAVRDALTAYLKDLSLVSGIYVETISAQYHPINIEAEVRTSAGYVIGDVKDYLHLGFFLCVSEVTREILNEWESNGIKSLIEYLNLSFGYTFDAESSAVADQIERLLGKVGEREWGKPVYSHIFHTVADTVLGVDTITLLSPGAEEIIEADYLPSAGTLNITSQNLPERNYDDELKLDTFADSSITVGTGSDQGAGFGTFSDSEIV